MLPEITAIAFSVMSLHFPNNGQNQFNPGIHVEMENVRLGYYRNSQYRDTAYVGYTLPIYSTKNFKFGVMAALGSGYGSPVIGGLEFVVSEHLVVMAVPGIPNYSSTIAGFAFRIPLEK